MQASGSGSCRILLKHAVGMVLATAPPTWGLEESGSGAEARMGPRRREMCGRECSLPDLTDPKVFRLWLGGGRG